MSTIPEPAEHDAKDWTVVIDGGCAECGYTPHEVTTTGRLLRESIDVWAERLGRADAATRPQPKVWSPVEYAAHVRDVCDVFRARLDLMLAEDDPEFANWDGEQAAIDADYFHQSPASVAQSYAVAAESFAAAYDAVQGDQWQRTGRRGDGMRFTPATLAVYFGHELHHHLRDAGA